MLNAFKFFANVQKFLAGERWMRIASEWVGLSSAQVLIKWVLFYGIDVLISSLDLADEAVNKWAGGWRTFNTNNFLQSSRQYF